MSRVADDTMPVGTMAGTPQVLLAHHLKQLKLPTVLREYEKVAREAARDGVDHPRYLLRLIELELIDRERRTVERRIRAARFPAVKSFDTFDFAAIPSLNKMLVLELARSEYILRRENIIALGNVIGSTLMVTSDRCLPLACGYEISVPATKTFLNQVVAFLYLAMRLGGHPTAIVHDLPGLIEHTLAEVEPQVPRLAQALLPWSDTYCLGYGATYPIALEGALKLKEVTYIHCEGMLSTEFKHGPLSAVSEGYPVVFVAGPENMPLIVSGINEVSCRGGRTIIISEEDPRLRANGHEMLVLPKAGPLLSPILAILPLQLLAYRVSVAKGFDPDFPRNLSKTLTVD